jgi:hypothetical protein
MDKVFPLGNPRNTLRNVLGVRPETPAERGLFTWAATVFRWLVDLVDLLTMEMFLSSTWR